MVRSIKKLFTVGMVSAVCVLGAVSCSDAEVEPLNDTTSSSDEAGDELPVAYENTLSSDATGLYRSSIFHPREMVVTNIDPTTYFDDDQQITENEYAILEVAIVKQNSGDTKYSKELFTLIGPDGERITPTEMYDFNGEPHSGEVKGLSTAEVDVAFEISEPIEDLAGWSLQLADDAEKISETINLDGGEQRGPYPLQMDSADTIAFEPLTLATSCPEIEYTVNPIGISADIENYDLLDARADKGKRYIFVEFNGQNGIKADLGSSDCDLEDIRLVDDRFQIKVDGSAELAPLEFGITDLADDPNFANMGFLFEIDRDVETIEFQDGDGATLATWEPELPSVEGE